MIVEQQFKVLVVDDDRSSLEILFHILGDEYQLTAAKSGRAALSRAMENQPDLILLDVVMQDMAGFEVLNALKKSEQTRKIPVIFITALSSTEDEEKGFALGAVDYITKPFNNSIVKARVRSHLQIVHQMRVIEQLGLMDSLTNLPNRRCFDMRIELEWSRAIREKIPISLFMIDVDNFKRYNDAYGHSTGDRLLKRVAKIFVEHLKRSTDFAARIGGEEFAIILPNTDVIWAKVKAEEIRLAVENMTAIPDQELRFPAATISIGVTGTVPQPGQPFHELLNSADVFLYQAKKAGRNQVYTDCGRFFLPEVCSEN